MSGDAAVFALLMLAIGCGCWMLVLMYRSFTPKRVRIRKYRTHDPLVAKSWPAVERRRSNRVDRRKERHPERDRRRNGVEVPNVFEWEGAD